MNINNFRDEVVNYMQKYSTVGVEAKFVENGIEFHLKSISESALIQLVEQWNKTHDKSFQIVVLDRQENKGSFSLFKKPSLDCQIRVALPRAPVSPFGRTIEKFCESPKEFYHSLNERRKQAIDEGFGRNNFPFPEIKESIEGIKGDLREQKEKLLQSILTTNSPYNRIYQTWVNKITELESDIEKIEKGVLFTAPKTQKRMEIVYPYENSIRLCLEYTNLFDKMVRFDKFMGSIPTEEAEALYIKHESQQQLGSESEKMTALYTNLMEEMYKLDYNRALKKMKQSLEGKTDQKSVDYLELFNKGIDIKNYNVKLDDTLPDAVKKEIQDVKDLRAEINKLTIYPPPFQAVKNQREIQDIFELDCFLLPSFAPLDLDFFLKTWSVPIGVMGLTNTDIFGDGFHLTPLEFAVHDIDHLFFQMNYLWGVLEETGMSMEEGIKVFEGTRKYFERQIEKIEQPELRHAVISLLFEYLHEIGSPYDVASLTRDDEKGNIYGMKVVESIEKNIDDGYYLENQDASQKQQEKQYLHEAADLIRKWSEERARQVEGELGLLKRDDNKVFLGVEFEPGRKMFNKAKEFQKSNDYIKIKKSTNLYLYKHK